MNRRRLLSALTAGAAYLAGRAWPFPPASARPAAAPTTPRLSIADNFPYLRDPPDKIKKRFDLYRQIGIGTLRSGIGWWSMEDPEGHWRDPEPETSYFKLAVGSGFRLKLTVGTIGAPAHWFLDAHPDARIRDAKGGTSVVDISFWYPGLHELLAEKADRMFEYLAQAGLFGTIDFIFVDLGPASEPIYPAQAPPRDIQAHGPWFYDDHARTAFRRAMREKYDSIARANRAWGTSFAAWVDVEPPRQGEYPGGLWQDALLWYRDSKRAFVRWQVSNYRRALDKHAPMTPRPKLIIMVPGAHILPIEWRQAAQTAHPDYNLTIMSDSEFLLEFAKATGCWLQYTGVEAADQVAYLRQYMKQHHLNQPMWGENAGSEAVARNPGHLADVVLANGLYGLEYINSGYIFGPDGVTPNATFSSLSAAYNRLRRTFG